MSKSSNISDFIEHLKKQKWLIPLLIIIFLLLLGSMIFLSEDSSISPFLYQKF
jgi:TRAP-type C4-dicarboxylate transport system permease large subunit